MTVQCPVCVSGDQCDCGVFSPFPRDQCDCRVLTTGNLCDSGVLGPYTQDHFNCGVPCPYTRGPV